MLNEINSKYILKKVFKYIPEGIFLKLISHNKKLQKKLKLGIEDFKKFSNQIIIDAIPYNPGMEINIHIPKTYTHQKHLNELEQKKRNYIKDITVIRIIIEEDKEINSLKGLFKSCSNLEALFFVKFNRRDIIDMSDMFQDCHNLSKLDITKLKTDSVTTMENMFKECSKLKTIDISNFKTENVINMKGMFEQCDQLKELNISNLNTDKVEDMNSMFYKCASLIKINSLNLLNVKNIDDMFN